MSEPVAAIAASMAVDPSSQGAAVAQTAAMPSAQQQPTPVAAHDARTFAALMTATPNATSHAAGPSTLADGARSVAAQFGDLRSFEEMRHSMLQSVDLRAPVKTMFAMTDHAIEANMMFTKLHLSTSLASSATSLFGTLLKNQQ